MTQTRTQVNYQNPYKDQTQKLERKLENDMTRLTRTAVHDPKITHFNKFLFLKLFYTYLPYTSNKIV